MTQLWTLIFASLVLPWMLSTAAKQGRSKLMEVKKPKKHTVKLLDYELVVDSGPAAQRAHELPTCLLCVCLSGSVYCEEVTPDMTSVPTLPRETAYLYARFNQISKITNRDFADTATMRRIDLSGNLISVIEDGAFSKLSHLEELNLSENQLSKLPVLPNKLVSLYANFNQLRTQGVKSTIFRKLNRLAYLYLGNNELTAVPQLPESLHVVHLQAKQPHHQDNGRDVLQRQRQPLHPTQPERGEAGREPHLAVPTPQQLHLPALAAPRLVPLRPGGGE